MMSECAGDLSKMDPSQFSVPNPVDTVASSKIIQSDIEKVEFIYGEDLKTCHEHLHDECMDIKGSVRYLAIRSARLENMIRWKKSGDGKVGKVELSKFWVSPVSVDIGTLVAKKKGFDQPSESDGQATSEELAQQADEEPVAVKAKFLRLVSRVLQDRKDEQKPTRADLFWVTNIDIDELLEISTTEDGHTNTAADPCEMFDRLISVSDGVRISMETINEMLCEVRLHARCIKDGLVNVVEASFDEPIRLLRSSVQKVVTLKTDLKCAVTTEMPKHVHSTASKKLQDQVKTLKEYGMDLSTLTDVRAILDDLATAMKAMMACETEPLTALMGALQDLKRFVSDNSQAMLSGRAQSQSAKHKFAKNRGMTGMRSMVGMRSMAGIRQNSCIMDDPRIVSLTEKERRDACKTLLAERQRSKDMRKMLTDRNALLDRIIKAQKIKTVAYMVENGELVDARNFGRSWTGLNKSLTSSSLDGDAESDGTQTKRSKPKPSFIRIGTQANLGARPSLKSSKSQMFWDSDLSIDDILGQCDKAESAEDECNAVIKETQKFYMGDDDDKGKAEPQRRGGWARSQSMAFWSSDVEIDDLVNMMPAGLEQVEEGDEEEE